MLASLLLLCTQADPRHYFEAPVTDDEAPDYSVRIQHPMCFADVRRRLEAGQYASLDALASDVRLIASNAMSFNAPDTKFYRAAERLDAWLKKRNIIGITGIDTRALTARIRENGMPDGVIAHSPDG